MGIEIERKFLVDHEKWERLDKPPGISYRQGYILSNAGQTIRIRVSDKQAILNMKSKISQLSRKEFEYEIPLEDGLEILKAFTKNGTEKVRYYIPLAGKTWEVDVFSGDNTGLIVAEIELDSEDEAFDKPDWITIEVTDDDRYTNSNLAMHPYKNW
jgi:adenylate cyclase